MDQPEQQILLSTGTKVVLLADVVATLSQPSFRKGSVGMVVKAPVDGNHSYRLRFPEGGEGAFQRTAFQVLRAYQTEGMNTGVLEEFDLQEHVIYRCVIGSRAYGLQHEQSDTDLRGIYLPPARAHWSLYGIPEQLENKDNEECYWELQKFLVLALKANPNILECLCSPLVLYSSPLAEELREQRHIFYSRLAYQTYNGYVLSQFKKMTHRKEQMGDVNYKHAMHLIRLLHSGIHLLSQGEVKVRVDTFRDELLSIRHGEMSWEHLNKRRLALHAKFEEAYTNTRLPERPDYARANEFLIKARRSAVEDP